MEEGANVVLVQGTGNDVALGVPLGTLSDTVDTTYYGALNTLVDGLQVSPCLYPFDYGNDQGKGPGAVRAVYRCHAGGGALRRRCVLDMYHHGLMNPCIPAIKALRMPDGAHMTLEGLELYTAQIIGFLRQVGALGD